MIFQAEDFEQYRGSTPIIAIKGAKVSDYGGTFATCIFWMLGRRMLVFVAVSSPSLYLCCIGRSLSVLSSSVMQVNPDNLEEAFSLRGWYVKLREIINFLLG